MSENFLENIVAHKKSLLIGKKAFFEALKSKLRDRKHSAYRLFKKAVSAPGQLNLIAEIKKASPSKGIICKDFYVLDIARQYANAGAAALSVLTEDKFFLGKPTHVREVSENFILPVLAKDFFIDEVQIYEAFAQGASAVLLIAAILSPKELQHLLDVAHSLDIDVILEIHNDEELNVALDTSADIIGVNNRDLRTFEVDLGTAQRLVPKVPKDKTIVVESGITTHEDIVMLRAMNVNAVLIGETFLRASDIGQKVKELMHG